MKDIRDLKASSSILSVLSYGGNIEFKPFKIRATLGNLSIVVYRNGVTYSEHDFSIAGLNEALDIVK